MNRGHKTVMRICDPKAQAHSKAYTIAHREDVGAYDAAHREERKEYFAAYRVAHREAKEIYRKTHRAQAKAAYAVYRKEHLAEGAAKSAKRRALKRAATIGDQGAVKRIYERAAKGKRVRCYLCGELIPMGHRHVDHVIPLSQGGAHTAANLAVACDACNLSKGAKLPAEVGVLI